MDVNWTAIAASIPVLFLWWWIQRKPTLKPKRIFDGKNLLESYDYIVIGSGSAGCVLASRLATGKNSENQVLTNKKLNVLLVEAGNEMHREKLLSFPSDWGKIWYTEADWDLVTTPQEGIGNRRSFINKGKTTGGSSAINALMWVRGCKQDYDNWAKQGNEGWDYYSLLPVFKSLEDYSEGDVKFRGKGGPIKVNRVSKDIELWNMFSQSAQEAGFKLNNDYNNGEDIEGVSLTQESSDGKKRNDCFSAFIEPVLKDGNTNLHVVSLATATQILFDSKKKATGVELVIDGVKRIIKCNEEIILSAGSIGSPHLLLLSGIGPKEDLEKFHIPVVVDNNAVGKNYHDHIGIAIPAKLKRKLKLDLTGSGFVGHYLYTSSWSKKNTPNNGPDIQVICTSLPHLHAPSSTSLAMKATFSKNDFKDRNTIAGIIWRSFYRAFLRLIPRSALTDIYYLGIVNNQPKSRGSLRLKSRDPFVVPDIDPKMGSAPEDIERLVEASLIAKKVMESGPLGKELKEFALPKSWDEKSLTQFVKDTAFLPWHPVGSCKMGNGDDAVVDSFLRVKGVTGLRVADASIMPTVVSGNTNWPSIMIGAKAADIILSQLKK